MAKKKIFYHSDFSLLKTGFGKAAKLVLSYLHNTGKYDIVHFCCGMTNDNPEFARVPWKCIGAVSDSNAHADPKLAQQASYGAFSIDAVMKKEKPDIYIGVQDIWGCDFAISKSWFSPENMAIWTTLDSLPILPTAVKAASETKNFWCWSDFATKSLRKLGHDHVKTLRGPLNINDFYKVDPKVNAQNRHLFQIPQDDFIVGFVFRNQLRKSVPNLLEGYKIFLDQNPEVKGKSKLLLHTNFSEGWGIQKLAKELHVNETDILTTYVCGACGSFGVHNFKGQHLNCPHCGKEKAYSTTGITSGVSEDQLNQVYNLMDVYCHPFTSGGQEIPIQEAKLTELVTLVTNYSCGEDNCTPDSASLALDWSQYREHNTEFIKASTTPQSIADQLSKALKMSNEEKEAMGKKARQWVIDNFATEVIGKQIEEFVDTAPALDKDKVYKLKFNKDPLAVVDPSLPDTEWLIAMYKNILDMEVNEKDSGLQYWTQEMRKGAPRDKVEKYFRQTASKEQADAFDLRSVIDDDDSKKILYVMPGSIGDVYMSTSIFKSLKEKYPDYKLYVATSPQYKEVLLGNQYVHKVIDHVPNVMDSIHYLQGFNNRAGTEKDAKGFFDIAFLAHVPAQRISTYAHQGLDEVAFDLKY